MGGFFSALPPKQVTDFSKYEKRRLAILLRDSLDAENYTRRFDRLGKLYERSEKSVYELGKFASGMGYEAIKTALTNAFGKKVGTLHTLIAASPFDRRGYITKDAVYRKIVTEIVEECFSVTFEEALQTHFPLKNFDPSFRRRMDEMFGVKDGGLYDYYAQAKDRVLLDLARLIHKNFEAELKIGDINNTIWMKIVRGYARLIYLYFASALDPRHEHEANLLEILVDIAFHNIPVGHCHDHWTLVIKKSK